MAEIMIVQGDGPVLTEAEERAMEERERHLTHVIDALDRLTDALRVLLDGGAPDIDALDAGAAVLGDFARGKVAGPRPITDDDVAAAHHLVDLVRAGAPKEEIAAAAQRVVEILSGPLEPALSEVERLERDTLDRLRTHHRIELTEDDMRIVRRHAELLARSRRERSGVSEELLATMYQIRDISERNSARKPP